MDDLAALARFMSARLDEEEAGARKLADMLASAPGADLAICFDDNTSGNAFDFNPWDRVADYDPARALREVAAKRARLERWLAQSGYYPPDGVHDGRDPDEQMRDEAVKYALEAEVREDAAVWSDHPDYRKEWAP